jgi:hypothetical protein
VVRWHQASFQNGEKNEGQAKVDLEIDSHASEEETQQMDDYRASVIGTGIRKW